jgi:hypothetical protein
MLCNKKKLIIIIPVHNKAVFSLKYKKETGQIQNNQNIKGEEIPPVKYIILRQITILWKAK